jgi:hypothetical protein
MTDKNEPPSIKITDRRHFDSSGAKRTPEDQEAAPREGQRVREAQEAANAPASPGRPASAQGPEGPERTPAAGATDPAPGHSGAESPQGAPTEGIGDLSEMAMRLTSSFSLLVARLAQETEIYLGLVPFPGKETAEPDLEAARAMIDMLSMLQEKTRGNLDPEEAHLLENLLYTYRLEFVRRRSGG